MWTDSFTNKMDYRKIEVLVFGDSRKNADAFIEAKVDKKTIDRSKRLIDSFRQCIWAKVDQETIDRRKMLIASFRQRMKEVEEAMWGEGAAYEYGDEDECEDEDEDE